MDLTPETLRSATFRDKLRGYHPDDVDEFLESVARGLEVLLARLRDASERARATVVAEPTPDADEAVRTLSLAQRTADLAIHEAKTEAERLLKAADQRARKVVGDAEESAVQLAEAAQDELRADLEKLQAARDQLFGEVNSLGSWLRGERSRIRRALIEVADRVESVKEKGDAPAVRPTAVPEPPRQRLGALKARAAASPPPVVERPRPASLPSPPPVATTANPKATPPRGQSAVASRPAPLPERAPVRREPAPAREPEPATPAAPGAPKAPASSDDAVLQRAQMGITEQRPDDTFDDDPYFAELRAAMQDDTPLGPRDDDWQSTDAGPTPPPGGPTS
ncbi:MAG: DivIVA domain-containing protein [Actinobacteria bacterium]|nr:DivIVA domain-containing protein [Actinomycetota bacterium]